MCYAIPGKVISLTDKKAVVEYFGETKSVINEISELKVGDYIYAQGGYSIQIVPENEAIEILNVWKETFFELQDKDLRLSRLAADNNNLSKKLTLILDKAAEGRELKPEDYLYLLNLTEPAEMELLFKTANFIRQKHLGNSCCVHGIIEFSNHCTQDCCYCGIRAGNQKIKRIRLTPQEIIDAAVEAVEKYGFKALVLQSGEDPFFTVEIIKNIIIEIKKRLPVLIFISCGEIGLPGLEILYQAGARGLLMRFETSNPELYQQLHPGSNWQERIDHLRRAYELGYLVITGSLIGIPGQTNQDLLNDLLLTKSLQAEMYSFGPFIPSPDTPLQNTKLPETDTVLKVLAVARIIDPENAKILITTGFETLDKDARAKGLMAGGNSVMLNASPEKLKESYQIYPNRAHLKENLQEQIETTIAMLRSLGRAPTDLGID